MTTQQIVDLLNDAFKIDPAAIDALLCACVPANKGLCDHPTIQVRSKNNKLDFPIVGLLGIINGIAGIDGDIIYAMYDDNTHCLTHFERRTDPYLSSNKP